jgi:hypothetical protein
MKGRLIVLDQIAVGSKTIVRQLAAWLSARGFEGRERAKTAAARSGGAFASAWFVGGILYALGLLVWGCVVVWLVSSVIAGRHVDENPSPTVPPAPPEPEEAGQGGEFSRTEFGGGGGVILRDTAEDRHNRVRPAGVKR